MITYEEIKKANDATTSTPIKGKNYVEVNQRIKAFRMVFPDGFIITNQISSESDVAVFVATVGFYERDSDGISHPVVIGTGTAREKEGSNFINETSYIENCETSAVGRALGMAGFGIGESVASYEEVANAKANQGERKASPKQLAILRKYYTGETLEKLLATNNVEKIEDLSIVKASELIGKLNGGA